MSYQDLKDTQPPRALYDINPDFRGRQFKSRSFYKFDLIIYSRYLSEIKPAER